MSVVGDPESGAPIFKAVSSSARQLFQLLNCIRFAPKVQVQISNEGLRFAVEESRVMQGIVFLDKALFTSFNCILPASEVDEDDPDSFASDLPNFQISLSALLETLQIFGASDASKYILGSNAPYCSFTLICLERLHFWQLLIQGHLGAARSFKTDNDGYGSNIRRDRPNAFSNQALGMSGVCRLSYAGVGSPFSIILEESGVTTTCNLNTYEPESSEEIPFQRVSSPSLIMYLRSNKRK